MTRPDTEVDHPPADASVDGDDPYADRTQATRMLAETVFDASDKDLRDMVGAIREELARRALARHVTNAWKGGMRVAAVAMLGVTHALTCRAFLRHSKGHKPFALRTNGRICTASDVKTREPCAWEEHVESGGSPQHGRMWSAADGAQAERTTRWWTPNEFVGGRTSTSPLTLSALSNAALLRAYGYPWPTAAEPKNVVVGQDATLPPRYGLDRFTPPFPCADGGVV